METCRSLLRRNLRRNLFMLFSYSAGKYGLTSASSLSQPTTTGTTSNNSLETDSNNKKITTTTMIDLQFISLQAMSALLCCGPFFDTIDLLEDSLLYQWLSGLLNSNDEKVRVLFTFCLIYYIFIYIHV